MFNFLIEFFNKPRIGGYSMRTIYGITAFVGGFGALSVSFISGLMFMICGCFLYRPATRFIEKKLKRQFSRNAKIAIVFISGLCGTIFLAEQQEQKRLQEHQKIVKKQQQEEEAFNKLPKEEQERILKERAEAAAHEEKLRKRRKVDAEFAKSDGECVDISLFVKNKLNDPSSFEHVQTTHVFWDDERVYVNVIFRAKNGFGAIRMGEYALIMDYDFNFKEGKFTKNF